VTTVCHYDDDAENPIWMQENPDTYILIVAGVSEMGGIWNSDNGQVTWRLANLHGDLVATIHPDDAGMSATTDASEYGSRTQGQPSSMPHPGSTAHQGLPTTMADERSCVTRLDSA
jgi:hypothetical protein